MAAAAPGYIELTFRVYRADDEWLARCDELGVMSCGTTLDEAFENIAEATRLYLDEIEETGERARIFAENGLVVHPGVPDELSVERNISARANEIVSPQAVRVPAA